jgi:hypothetical protein
MHACAQSPLFSLWSAHDNLYDGPTTQWTGAVADFAGVIRVDGVAYTFLGSSATTGGNTCEQESVQVASVTTHYRFRCGVARKNDVELKVMFTSPLITSDWELLSRPTHYVTFKVTSLTKPVKVQIYIDFSGEFVMNDAKRSMAFKTSQIKARQLGETTLTALRLGAARQTPLSSTDDLPSWGILYMVSDSSLSTTAIDYSNSTRGAFVATGALPNHDNPLSPLPLSMTTGAPVQTGPEPSVDRPGNDLPNYPVQAADADACWRLCNEVFVSICPAL